MYPVKGGRAVPKEPVSVEVVQEGDERFIVRTFADGTMDRLPVIKLPRKSSRFPYRSWTLDKSRKKGFEGDTFRIWITRSQRI